MNSLSHNGDTNSTMRHRTGIGIASALILGLAACAPTPRDIQLFAAPPAVPAKVLTAPILLAPIDAAPTYLSKDISYRLHYETDRTQSYSDSRWTEPPIAQLARSLHATSNNLLALNEQRQTAHCALNIELLGYDHVFSSAQQSHGEIHLRYALTHLRSHRKLKHGELRVEIPAVSADARGGATALQHANQDATAQLLDWLHASLNEAESSKLCAR
ncbi:MAG: ABC-type transport auxiliary lipoprotein family protein [Gallionella sp.]|nr:ABC-type transport auxiliary lipoprotein family protein [Gallionella sp.]